MTLPELKLRGKERRKGQRLEDTLQMALDPSRGTEGTPGSSWGGGDGGAGRGGGKQGGCQGCKGCLGVHW